MKNLVKISAAAIFAASLALSASAKVTITKAVLSINGLNGTMETYYENGQLKEEVNYKDGQVVQENLETELKDFCNIAYEDDKLKLEFD